MKKKTKGILIGTGALAGVTFVAAAASYITSKKLINLALDRPTEKEKPDESVEKKVSGMDIEAEIKDIRTEAIERLEKSNLEKIEILASDGTKLVAHWFEAENAKRTIIAMHGWRSSWIRDFAIISEFWHKNNCNVLYVEQRGQNNSGGDYMGFGMLERYDCLDWINWVNDNKSSELTIYLCGISMGASTVMMAGGLDLPKNVHGIMADCGYTSPHAIWKHVVEKNMNLYYGGIASKIADDMCKRKIQMGSKDVSCTDTLRICKVPVMFIHGTDDHFVPVEMTYENYKACASEKHLLIVPGAEHGMSYIVEQEKYEQEALGFWEAYDN